MKSLLWVGVVTLAVAGVAIAADKPDLPAMQQAGGASAGTQVAKDKDGGYTLRTSTKLVVLDVMVKDAQGRPVRGLKKEEFHVTEAKLPQTILNFEAAESHAIAPSVTVHSTAELDKEAPDAPVNILVLDEVNTRYEEMSRARYFLKQYLATQPERLAVPTMIVVATLTASEKQHDLKVISDYTQDRRALQSALEHYVPRYPWENEVMGMQFNLTRMGEKFVVVLSTLEKIAEAGKSHQGHKNVIWVGTGFSLLDIRKCGCVHYLNADIQQAVDKMREARVTVSSVNPVGETGYIRGMDFTTTAMFYSMVEATGGKAHYMYNDIDVQIGESARDGADFYTIAYRPTTDSQAPGKLRKIEVTVDRPGLTVAANKGYALPYAPTMKDLRAQKATDLLEADTSQMVYDGVPVTVRRTAAGGDAFVVTVDPAAMVWATGANGEQRAELALVASTFDAHGRELKRVAKNVHAEMPAGETPGQVKLPVEFAHDAKAVRMRVVVRVAETERMGSADVSLKQ